MDNFIIELNNVSKSLGGKRVIKNLNLKVREGEFVTLLGPSGCGKTTILRLIAGFISPDSGEILLDGKDISCVPPYRRPLNTVFQRYALFPHMDVYDNVAFGLKLKGESEESISKKVRQALKMVTLTGYENRYVDSLSGGQQQRVAIARALVNRPKVLLLDEPLSALDFKMRQDMQMELKEMHKKLGITFIYVTHDQEEALSLSDTIVVMNSGKILQSGTPEDIYNEPVNAYVADFIGESNIFDATMICDRKVRFLGHDFDCIDEGFGENAPVDVVVRPEDIYILNQSDAAQFSAVVQSCTFKGEHNIIIVNTDDGYELTIQDFNSFEVGSRLWLFVKPQDIQVMHKVFVDNSVNAVMTDSTHVSIFGGNFECLEQEGIGAGDKVVAKVSLDKIDMMDDVEDGEVEAVVRNIIYKGNHYGISLKSLSDNSTIRANSTYVWDIGDRVGVKILPQDIHIEKASFPVEQS